MKESQPPGESRKLRRRFSRRARLALLLMWLAALPAAGLYVSAQEPGGLSLFLPLLTLPSYSYLPAVARIPTPTPTPVPDGVPISILANPSFENESWFTDSYRNQHPSGWSFYAPNTGQPLPFPTKRQEGNVVPAVSGGQGEYVHKYYWQLPENERLGAQRGLILDGQLVYKVFSDRISHALQLSQTVSYVPGRLVRVTGYILGETRPELCSASGVLEDDHFIASVRLGNVSDTRFYNVMVTRFDVPGNERAWNKFSVTSQVPPGGMLVLTVIAQSNWGCPVDFFIDRFQAFDASPGPIPSPTPTATRTATPPTP